MPGWNHAFPPETGITAGAVHLYNDDRIRWCLDQAKSIENYNVLELGPLEGMHTYMLAKAGAKNIDAIEANVQAYLRCLIAREVLGFGNSRFFLGDYVKWLEESGRRYDLVVASGVLYHSTNPVRLLELVSKAADRFFLWTHYFDEALKHPQDLRGTAFSGHIRQVEFNGRAYDLHERHYYGAWKNAAFCGGLEDQHFWMTKADILSLIEALGFDCVTAHDSPDHAHGPAFSVFARRK